MERFVGGMILIVFLIFPAIAFAQEAPAGNKAFEIQKRLENIKDNETVESILNEYAGQEKKTDEHVVATVPQAKDLVPCKVEPFKITFSCDPKWATHQEGDSVIFDISTSPHVSVSISKVSDKIKLLEQINKSDLALTEQYADGFILQDALLKGKKVKQVIGFSRESPNIRYLDYYILDQGVLYGVLFAVDPKETWASYQFFIKAIAESVDFEK